MEDSSVRCPLCHHHTSSGCSHHCHPGQGDLVLINIFYQLSNPKQEEALEESEEQLENDMNQMFERLEEKMVISKVL